VIKMGFNLGKAQLRWKGSLRGRAHFVEGLTSWRLGLVDGVTFIGGRD